MEKKLKISLGDLVPIIKKALVDLQVSQRRLTYKIFIQDFFSVASNTGFVVVPTFMAGNAFVFLPQGNDTLSLVVERMSFLYFFRVIWLMLSVFFGLLRPNLEFVMEKPWLLKVLLAKGNLHIGSKYL